jgi:hypothetical protein
MSHHTGFTADRLGHVLIDAGFAEAHTKRGSMYDIWAVGMMPETNKRNVLTHLRKNKLDFFPEEK